MFTVSSTVSSPVTNFHCQCRPLGSGTVIASISDSANNSKISSVSTIVFDSRCLYIVVPQCVHPISDSAFLLLTIINIVLFE